MLNNKMLKARGFTLIEVAVVLVIVGFVLASFVGSLSQRIETTQRNDTKAQLENIKTALLGFIISNGRLPCPTTTTGNGFEVPAGGGNCTLQHGFIPGKTLGIDGTYNRDNLLVDVWRNPIRYSVTSANVNAFTTEYTAPGGGGMKDIGMANLSPDINICDGDSTLVNTCDASVRTLINNAPYVILSLGKDGSDFVTNLASNSDQGENAGEALVIANAAGENIAYTVSNGNAFVNKVFSDAGSTAGQYDDLIMWESPFIIYSKMLEAGHLP